VNGVRRILLFFFTYYFSQGVFNGSKTFEQPFLRSRGVSLTDIAAAASVAIVPWSVKVLFALPADAIGLRRPFIFGGLLSAAAGMYAVGALGLAGPAQLPAWFGLVFARNAGMAFSDVACDAMSVDCRLDHMAGTVQAVMSFGRTVGSIIGQASAAPIVRSPRGPAPAACLCSPWGSGGGPATANMSAVPVANCSSAASPAQQQCELRAPPPAALVDYAPVWYMLASVVALGAPAVFFVKEERLSGAGADFEFAALRNLGSRSMLCYLAFCMTSNFANGLVTIPIVELGQRAPLSLDGEAIGNAGTLSTVGDLVGSVAFGLLYDRLPRRLLMGVAAIAAGASYLVFLYLARSERDYLVLRFLSGLTDGAIFVCNCGGIMVLADKRAAASFFAIAVSLMNFATMIGSAVSGRMLDDDKIGLGPTVWAGAVFAACALFAIPGIAPPAASAAPAASRSRCGSDSEVGEAVLLSDTKAVPYTTPAADVTVDNPFARLKDAPPPPASAPAFVGPNPFALAPPAPAPPAGSRAAAVRAAGGGGR